MIIPRLALKNLLGAGLRTWLNVLVLSFAFVAIIWTQGLYIGINDQAEQAKIEAEYAGGQYWHDKYDPFDLLSLQDAHGIIPLSLQQMIEKKQATPILMVQGAIYPNGRIQSVLIKGIDPRQTLISLPSQFLQGEREELPALIGSRMAENSGLKVGDLVTIRWRDAQGTFDARDVLIVQIMKTSVQSIDLGQIWVPLSDLQDLAQMENEATIAILARNTEAVPEIPGWGFKNLDFLLRDIKELVQSKTVGASIMYVMLLLLAMLAIFNTQVLSIFRRKKEIGTLVALGFTKGQVIRLFTLEGAMHGLLAAGMAAIYGIPLLVYFATKGWALPDVYDSYGFALGEKLFPVYSVGLIVGTTILVFLVTSIVSFMPTRKIAKLKPTEALRGRIS